MATGVVLPKVWRSEIQLLLLFLLSSVLSVYLSRWLPGSVIKGELFQLGRTKIFLSLPLFWFIPAGFLGTILLRIYDVRYRIDGSGIETTKGILGLTQTIVRVRFEDIRSIEAKQTILDRILNVGHVEIGTAATSGVEVFLHGVSAPQEIREMVSHERDRRQKIKSESSNEVKATENG